MRWPNTVEVSRSTLADLEIKKRVQDVYLATGQLQLAADLDKELLKVGA